MYILGINAYHGDSSACIFKDDHFIAAIEEERILRIKHWAGLPVESIKFCLNEAGISIQDVDHITISRDPKANFRKKIFHAIKNMVGFSAIKNRLANAKKISSLSEELVKAFNLGNIPLKAKIHDIEHHRSHMASAFFASPFQEAAILSIDGFGDFSSTMIGIGRGNKIEVLDAVHYPHSLGVFYTAFTQYLGFPHYGDEYKVMGLAPYGEPKYVDKLHDVMLLKDNGLFEINPKYFKHVKHGVSMSWENGSPDIGTLYTDYMVEKFGPARQKGEELTQYHKDMASSVQRMCELTIFHILKKLHERTGLDNLCLAGGVAQNSVANGKITQNTPFKHLYVPSAGHDAGTSMGSALFLYNQILNQPRIAPLHHASWGRKSSNEEIEAFLKSNNVDYQRYDDEQLLDIVSDCLCNGGVIGWFQGRAEFGPRALGNRSIIVDPSRRDAKDLLNSKIKRRESFRPFAPSILKEHVDEYFERNDDVPFMEKVFKIREEKRGVIPAVTHVDGTGRLQTVDSRYASKYHALISRFYKKSGIPILLNTSFNENEPIVNSPEEAYDCFARTQMDMLIMENIVIKR